MDAHTAHLIKYASRVSFVTNLALFGCNLAVFVLTGSLSLLSAAVDSLLDLISQVIVYAAMRGNKNVIKTRYPVGRSRLEPVGIVVVSSVMGVASFQILLESFIRLGTGIAATRGTNGEPPPAPHLELYAIIMVVCAVIAKVVLYFVCKSVASRSSEMRVLAEDHRNDVLANSTALGCAVLAAQVAGAWFVDPLGAILIALYIISRWIGVGRKHAGMLVGKSADTEFVSSVERMIENFDPIMKLDVVSAYHFGARYLVEAEVVVPRETSIVVAHDLALALQKKIELLEEVERAHVHVDYQYREEDEHFYKDVIWNEHVVRAAETTTASREDNRDDGSPRAAQLYNRRRGGRRQRAGAGSGRAQHQSTSPETARDDDDDDRDDDVDDGEVDVLPQRPSSVATRSFDIGVAPERVPSAVLSTV